MTQQPLPSLNRDMYFIVNGFPLPPSVNGLYAHNGQRMVKSKVYRVYERDIQAWCATHQDILKGLRAFITDLAPWVLSVDTNFLMKRKSIVCLDGRPKKNDTSNRIKALHDVLSAIMGLDDSYFWSGAYDKFAIDDDNEGVDLVFRLRRINA